MNHERLQDGLGSRAVAAFEKRGVEKKREIGLAVGSLAQSLKERRNGKQKQIVNKGRKVPDVNAQM